MATIIFGLLPCLLLAVSLVGCSAVRIGYQNAPNLLYWWIDSYVDFDDTQSIQARDALASLHAWHARQELPAYIGLLRNLQAMAIADLTPQQVCAPMQAIRDHLHTLLTQAEPGIAALLPSVKPTQIDHLSRQFDKRNQKWRAQWLEGTPPERRERRLKQAVERYESFYGSLEEAQLAVLRANIERSRFDPNLRYQETLQRQREALQALRQLLASNKAEAGASSAVHSVVEHLFSSPDPALRARFEADFQDSCRAMAELHNSTTPAQRRKAIATLKNYEDDLRAVLPVGR